jgi:hypothetical protein
MLSRVRPPTILLSRKVFISRSQSARRRFVNEESLYERLKKEGFERYCLDHLSVDDQIQLFSNAEIIIGPHGAGLANLIFCKPGTTIIEILQALEDNFFCCLSQTLELPYVCVQTVDFNVPQNTVARYADTFLSEETIEAILSAVNNPPLLKDSPLGIPLKSHIK